MEKTKEDLEWCRWRDICPTCGTDLVEKMTSHGIPYFIRHKLCVNCGFEDLVCEL